MRIRKLEMLVFQKILRTYQMHDPLSVNDLEESSTLFKALSINNIIIMVDKIFQVLFHIRVAIKKKVSVEKNIDGAIKSRA